jgi:alginate O-acetyltransferase complex protein AlgI
MIQDLNYWLFLLVIPIIYWLLPLSMRTWLLSFACIVFLFFVEPLATSIMLAFSVAFYFGLRSNIPESWDSPVLLGLIVAVIGYLSFFKYLPVAVSTVSGTLGVDKILIPLGISYFTFKLIHYGIEVRRRTLPEHSLQDVLSYIFLVPIFTAGPIERFDHFMRERQCRWNMDFLVEGLTRIGHGLIKRFVFGAFFLTLIDRLTSQGGVVYFLENLEHIPAYHVWAYLCLSYLYIYMDFSGYTDIAIGASRLFGLRIMENFNFPIFASNIGIFWKRWHMTLAGWCQSYVYMPMLGWTRKPFLAVVTAFFVMGLWHAASLNWIAWGLYNAAGISIFQIWLRTERRRKWSFMKRQPFKYAGIPMTFLFFAGSCAFTTTDAASNLYGALRLLAKCFFIVLPA